MGSRMKNFNIFGVHGKIQVLGGQGGGVHEKPIYRGDCLKRDGWAWTVRIFKGGTWQEGGGGIFEGGLGGGLIPQCTL